MSEMEQEGHDDEEEEEEEVNVGKCSDALALFW